MFVKFLWVASGFSSGLSSERGNKKNYQETFIKSFHATGLFRYPLKRSENQRFYDVFRVYRKRPMSCNGLKTLQKIITGKYFLTVNYKEPDNNLLILVKVNIKGTSMTLFEVKHVDYMHYLVTVNNSLRGQCFSC